MKRKNESDSGGLPESSLQLQCCVGVHRLRDACAELDKLIAIISTLPISTASCERSFRTLQIVKSYLRTNIGNKRLHDLHDLLMFGIQLHPNSI
jgi:hAT family C-terminal dimerisation region